MLISAGAALMGLSDGGKEPRGRFLPLVVAPPGHDHDVGGGQGLETGAQGQVRAAARDERARLTGHEAHDVLGHAVVGAVLAEDLERDGEVEQGRPVHGDHDDLGHARECRHA